MENTEREEREKFERELMERFPEFSVKKKKDNYILHIGLFIFTFITTTLGGVFWIGKDPYDLNNFAAGIPFSFLTLTIITAHEFGHYIAARIHKVDVTLPYYIPFPFFFLNPFGTMGAVIRMRSPVATRRALFDIGVAGPIAGWVASIIILIIGFVTLPPIDYLYSIHPSYATNGVLLHGEAFGNNIIFLLFEKFLVPAKGFMPPMTEVYHYPFLCAGWFGLLITALNMMPAGQLDGGHISYTMFGRKNAAIIAYVTVGVLFTMGILGLLPLFGIEINAGSINWLFWALLIIFAIKIKHPPTVEHDPEPLSDARMLIGWFTYLILVLSSTPIPIYEM